MAEETESLLSRPEGQSRSPKYEENVYLGRRYFICIFSLKFVVQFVFALIEIPFVRLLEVAACTKYYHQHAGLLDESELDCKIEAIQNKVALLLGLKFTFDAIPGLSQLACFCNLPFTHNS
jgi:hypothetical protein